jgi:hypothetical protein
VLDGAVEVEVGSMKEKATFRREQGDYVIANPALVKLLASPGSHALVFTVSAGKDSDLLDGAIQISGVEGNGGTHAHASYGALAAWIAAALVVLGAIALFLRHRRGAGVLR